MQLLYQLLCLFLIFTLTIVAYITPYWALDQDNKGSSFGLWKSCTSEKCFPHSGHEGHLFAAWLCNGFAVMVSLWVLSILATDYIKYLQGERIDHHRRIVHKRCTVIYCLIAGLFAAVPYGSISSWQPYDNYDPGFSYYINLVSLIISAGLFCCEIAEVLYLHGDGKKVL